MGSEPPEIVYLVLIVHMRIFAAEEDHSCHKILKRVYDTPHSTPERLRVTLLMGWRGLKIPLSVQCGFFTTGAGMIEISNGI